MRETKGIVKEVINDKEVIIEKISNYVNDVMLDYFPTFISEHREDLYQEGILAVLENIDKYDASKGRLTTFFHIRIVHAMYSYVATQIHGISEHYLQKITQINRRIQYYECLNNIIEPEIIMKDLKMSQESYDNATRINSIISDKVDPTFNETERIPVKENVEDVIIRKENIKEIAMLLNNLEEKDKFIVDSRLGLTEKKEKIT